MHIFAAFIISMCLLSSFHPFKENPKGLVDIDIGVTNPVPVNLYVKSVEEIQRENIVSQTHDFSCGSASLATLLNFYLGENFTETQVIQGLMEYGDKKKISQRRAFSLLDMKKFVDMLGYKSAGYKATIDDIIELDMPGILPIEFLGYRHFTVFRGIHGNHIFLADPYRGNTSYPIQIFKEMWYENVVFLAYPENGKKLTALELSNEDLLYVYEDSIADILDIHKPRIEEPRSHQQDFFFTLPDDYRKYRH